MIINNRTATSSDSTLLDLDIAWGAFELVHPGPCLLFEELIPLLANKCLTVSTFKELVFFRDLITAVALRPIRAEILEISFDLKIKTKN